MAGMNPRDIKFIVWLRKLAGAVENKVQKVQNRRMRQTSAFDGMLDVRDQILEEIGEIVEERGWWATTMLQLCCRSF